MTNHDRLSEALIRHGILVAIPMVIAVILGVSIGFWSSRSPIASTLFTNGFNALRVIPSLVILFLAIPYFGLTVTSAVIALTILAIPPVLLSTDVAFRTIDSSVKEAAVGMGMSMYESLRMVEFPLAIPVILAGIKTATIEVISSATLAAFIGAGGLGDFVVLGFAQYDPAILLVGAIPTAAMALMAELGFSLLQRSLQHE